MGAIGAYTVFRLKGEPHIPRIRFHDDSAPGASGHRYVWDGVGGDQAELVTVSNCADTAAAAVLANTFAALVSSVVTITLDDGRTVAYQIIKDFYVIRVETVAGSTIAGTTKRLHAHWVVESVAY